MKEYLFLFLNTNKNYFFEKYKFLKKDKLKKFYNIYFISKGILGAIILLFLSLKFSEYRNILFSIPYFIYFSKLLNLDSKKWGHYYRNDWILAYPNDLKRFITLLAANIIIDFFIVDNILLYMLIQMTVYDFTVTLTIYTIITLVYVLILSVQFVIMQSNLLIKKIYSVLVYLLSSILTGFISYILIGFLIKFTKSIFLKEDIMSFIIFEIQYLLSNIVIFFRTYNYWIMVIVIIGSILNGIFLLINFKAGNFQNGKQNTQAKISDFLFIKVYNKLFEWMYNDYEKYMKKELSLIVELYKFNYKEYLNTFFIDRSVFFLLGILCVIVEYNHYAVPYIVFFILLLFFYIDISSGINAKLLPNMSFVSDYNTIQICNSVNRSIHILVRNKLRFFRIVRLPSLIFYLVIVGICGQYFRMNSILVVALLLCIIIFWCLLPKIFMSNNLIYVRSNYDRFEKFIEENSMILRDTKDFFLIEMYYRYIFFCMVVYIVLVFMLNSSFTIYLFVAILFSELLFLVILYLIMSRVIKNICNSLEMGDYSIDVARIFKR